MINNSDKRTCMSKDEFDRITCLPDEMLQHILSFLGIREAVQTSLVSKRWVNIWTSLSRLNFDPHEFVSVDEYRLSTDDRKKTLDAKFKEFVEELLSRRKASFLGTFQIKILDQDGCSDLVRTCVSYAMKFNSRVFSMETSFTYTEISACIFSCESIEELCLRTSSNFPKILEVGNLPKIPEVVNLPCIRRLQLKQTKLDNKCITRLFSGCPVLEDVSLERCIGEFSCIFSQKLKYLSIRDCVSFLHCKRYMIVRSLDFSLENAVKSTIVIHRTCPFTIQFVWKTLGTTVVGNAFTFIQNVYRYLDLDDYFGGFSDASVLRLHSQDMMSILEAALPKLQAFHNLMDLHVGSWCMTCNFSPVALFLQQTPNLQKITLYMCARHCRGEETDIHQLMDNLMWMDFSRCKKPKLVCIKLLKDYIRAHKIDKALLPSRKQLENIEIIISEHI